MSIRFSDYSIQANVNYNTPLNPVLPLRIQAANIVGTTRVSSAVAATMGVGWANLPVQAGNLALTVIFPANTAPLQAELTEIAAYWWLNRREAARRTVIDAILRFARNQSLWFSTDEIYAEWNVGAAGAAGQIAAPTPTQVGHGPIDYVLGSPALPGVSVTANALGANPARTSLRIATRAAQTVPIYGRSLVIEAKSSIRGNGSDTKQWQLIAQLLTTAFLANPRPRYHRGVLTDGRYWRFYQLDVQAPRTVLRSDLIDVASGNAPPNIVIQDLFGQPVAMSNLEIVVEILTQMIAMSGNGAISLF